MKHTKGKLIMGDFYEKTMTFEIDGVFTLKAGNYFLIREEDYKAPEMYEALKILKDAYATECKIPNKKILVDVESLLKEIES